MPQHLEHAHEIQISSNTSQTKAKLENDKLKHVLHEQPHAAQPNYVFNHRSGAKSKHLIHNLTGSGGPEGHKLLILVELEEVNTSTLRISGRQNHDVVTIFVGEPEQSHGENPLPNCENDNQENTNASTYSYP